VHLLCFPIADYLFSGDQLAHTCDFDDLLVAGCFSRLSKRFVRRHFGGAAVSTSRIRLNILRFGTRAACRKRFDASNYDASSYIEV
jgi:hypothetical protein